MSLCPTLLHLLNIGAERFLRGSRCTPECRAVHLVQFLLPLKDNAKKPFPRALFDQVRAEMTDRFGGVTAFVQSPAVGLWENEGRVDRDEMILIEVMVKDLSRDWWANYRAELEERFEQDAVVVRAIRVDTL